MTDIEMTKLCAEAMGFDDVHIAHGCLGTAYVKYGGRGITQGAEFRPLVDDAQAMALVKKLRLGINAWNTEYQIWVQSGEISSELAGESCSFNADLNRAIVECVAKMQSAR